MAEELKKAWLQHEGKTLDAEVSKVEVVSVESVKQETKNVKDHKHKRVKVRLMLDVVVCGDCGVFLGVLLPQSQSNVNLNNVEET